jgi:hypothetical protein
VNDGLCFIPMIAEAFERSDPQSALRETFDRIKNIGRQPGRAEGFRQFLRFMDELAREHSRTGSTEESSVLDDVAASCVKRLTGTDGDPEATRTPDIAGPSASQETYERFCTSIRGATDRLPVREIIVERDGVMIAGFALEQAADTHTIHDAAPGHYLLCLESGRVLWECELTDQDLVWSAAFPGRFLPMAADSGHPSAEPTHEASLIGDRLVLCVHPGVESGSIAIIWRGQETRT